jgi:hypothetical protein
MSSSPAPPSGEVGVVVEKELDTSKHSTGSQKSNKSKDAAAAKPSLPPASFSELFQFAETKDLIVFGFGVFFSVMSAATMPCINIVFGDLIDSIATPINVEELVSRSVKAMALLGLYGFGTFFISFYLCGIAASKVGFLSYQRVNELFGASIVVCFVCVCVCSRVRTGCKFFPLLAGILSSLQLLPVMLNRILLHFLHLFLFLLLFYYCCVRPHGLAACFFKIYRLPTPGANSIWRTC